MSTKQLSLVLIKPDAVERELIGEIIVRLERKGLTIRAMKMVKCTEEIARRHYACHVEKSFFPSLLTFITSAPLVAIVLEGNSAISVIRNLVGSTDCCAASPGTIRGDLGSSKGANLIHASDSLEAAQYEIPIWFPEGILDWRRADQDWLEPDDALKAPLDLPTFLTTKPDSLPISTTPSSIPAATPPKPSPATTTTTTPTATSGTTTAAEKGVSPSPSKPVTSTKSAAKH